MPIEREKIRAALKDKGFKEKTNDHDYYYLYVNDKKTSVFTKLSRGSNYREYSDDLVSDVAHQIGLVKKEFLSFVECPLKHEEHITLLKQRNRIRY